MTKLQLPNGLNYCTLADGTRRCTGAKMGRKNQLWPYLNEPIKLHLQLLPIDSGGYDAGGAYWGLNSPGIGKMYVAWNTRNSEPTMIFVREWSREDAKKTIRNTFYRKAKFYR